METEYCNKCGLLHDPSDGDCIGCQMVAEIILLKALLKKALPHVTSAGDDNGRPGYFNEGARDFCKEIKDSIDLKD